MYNDENDEYLYKKMPSYDTLCRLLPNPTPTPYFQRKTAWCERERLGKSRMEVPNACRDADRASGEMVAWYECEGRGSELAQMRVE
jgi:hypothetical protein